MRTIDQRKAELQRGERTALAMAEEALANIASPSGQGAETFMRVYEQRARDDARASDRRRAIGDVHSAVDGLPIAIKDLFDVAEETTLAGSTVLEGAPVAKEDAEIVERLRAAGATIVGRTNMTEFAFSGLGLNPNFGTPTNPWDRETGRIPGGSSSGSGVAVVDAMCAAAIGTDTGGSVRIPAALCGIAGFKPTASAIPSRGTLPLSRSLDSVGVLAPTIACCARVADLIADVSMAPKPGVALRGLRLLVPTTLVQDNLDTEVARCFHRGLGRLSAAGAILVEVPVLEFGDIAQLHLKATLPAFEAWQWHRELVERGREKYDPRVLERILAGAAMDPIDYRDLVEARREWQGRMHDCLRRFDALLMPTVPIVAPPLEPLRKDDALYRATNALMLRNPSTINFLDGCAATVPCHSPGDAPVGLTIAAGANNDRNVIAIAMAVEAALDAALQRETSV